MLSSSVEHYRDLAISFFHSSKSGRRRGKSGQPKNGGGRMSSSEAKQSLLAMERLLLQLTHHAHHLGRSCVESLVAELKLVRDEELRLRWHLQQSGISNAIHIPHAIELQPSSTTANAKQVDQQDDLDVKRQCIVCQHICCLSAVVCSCSPVDVACIRHFNQLCKCKSVNKCLVYWVKISDMDQAIQRMRTMMETASGDEEGGDGGGGSSSSSSS